MSRDIQIIVEAAEEQNLIWLRWIREDRFDIQEGYVWPSEHNERVMDRAIPFTVITYLVTKTINGVDAVYPFDTNVCNVVENYETTGDLRLVSITVYSGLVALGTSVVGEDDIFTSNDFSGCSWKVTWLGKIVKDYGNPTTEYPINNSTYGIYTKLYGTPSLEPTPCIVDLEAHTAVPDIFKNALVSSGGVPITLTAPSLVQLPANQDCVGCEHDQLFGFQYFRFFNVYCQDILEESTDPAHPYLGVYVLVERFTTYIVNGEEIVIRHVDQHPIGCCDRCYDTTDAKCTDHLDSNSGGNSIPETKKDRKNNNFTAGEDIIEVQYFASPCTFIARDNCQAIAFYKKIEPCRDIYYEGFHIELIFQPGKWKLYHFEHDPCRTMLNVCDPNYEPYWTLRYEEDLNVTEVDFCWQPSIPRTNINGKAWPYGFYGYAEGGSNYPWNLPMWDDDDGNGICVPCIDDACAWGYRTLVVDNNTEIYNPSDIVTGKGGTTMERVGPLTIYPIDTTPESGLVFAEATPVLMVCPSWPEAEIYYTIDGSEPTHEPSVTNLRYYSPFFIAETTTIKAIAYISGYEPSVVSVQTYFITRHSFPYANQGYVTVNPSELTNSYVKVNIVGMGQIYDIFDPTKNLIGTAVNNSWLGMLNGGIKVNIDLGSPEKIERLIIENYHNSGYEWDKGFTEFTLCGSNDLSDFNNLMYSVDSGQIITVEPNFIPQHAWVDRSTPTYHLVNPNHLDNPDNFSYRYYSFRFSQGFGIRNIQMQKYITY